MSQVTLIAPLSNIQCPAPLNLGDDTEMHEFHPSLSAIVKDAQDKWIIRHPAPYSHCLVVRNAEITRADRSDAKERLEEAILRLRLYKAGSIGFNFAVLDNEGWYDKLSSGDDLPLSYEIIGVFFYVVWDRAGIPSTYELAAEDIEPLRSLFALAARRKLMDRPSFRFFFRAYHEPYASDRFLSNAIGLENLLVNDVRELSNITYKFVDRGCFLLSQAQPHPGGGEAYAESLRKIYEARSKNVHSNKKSNRDWDTPEEIALIRSAEGHLRTLLKYVLENPKLEDSNEVDRAKRSRYTMKIEPAA